MSKAKEAPVEEGPERDTLPESKYTLAEGVVVKEGDWASVLANVHSRRLSANEVNPFAEEVVVVFRSHNQDMVIPVLSEHVLGRANPPEGWPRCSALIDHHSSEPVSVLMRCERHSGHSGDHENPVYTWSNDATVGYMEDV